MTLILRGYVRYLVPRLTPHSWTFPSNVERPTHIRLAEHAFSGITAKDDVQIGLDHRMPPPGLDLGSVSAGNLAIHDNRDYLCVTWRVPPDVSPLLRKLERKGRLLGISPKASYYEHANAGELGLVELIAHHLAEVSVVVSPSKPVFSSFIELRRYLRMSATATAKRKSVQTISEQNAAAPSSPDEDPRVEAAAENLSRLRAELQKCEVAIEPPADKVRADAERLLLGLSIEDDDSDEELQRLTRATQRRRKVIEMAIDLAEAEYMAATHAAEETYVQSMKPHYAVIVKRKAEALSTLLDVVREEREFRDELDRRKIGNVNVLIPRVNLGQCNFNEHYRNRVPHGAAQFIKEGVERGYLPAELLERYRSF